MAPWHGATDATLSVLRQILPNSLTPIIVRSILGLAITVTILAANLLGNGLRDLLDPRLRVR